jgi:hypothetical protein
MNTQEINMNTQRLVRDTLFIAAFTVGALGGNVGPAVAMPRDCNRLYGLIQRYSDTAMWYLDYGDQLDNIGLHDAAESARSTGQSWADRASDLIDVSSGLDC